MDPSSRKPSVKDVARQAGVSIGTVSHVLNHPERVSEANQERVHAAMLELGYIRSDSARQLRQGISTLVGVIVLDISNPFFTEAAEGIDRRLRLDGCTMLLSSSDGNPQRELDLVRHYMSLEVRGIIITPARQHSADVGDALLETIKKSRRPAVLLDHPPLDENIPAVYIDDIAASQTVVWHLLSLGHVRIGYANGPCDVRQAKDRFLGAVKAVRGFGLDPDEVLVEINAGNFDADGGSIVAAKLLMERPPVTAIACANDQLAIGAMRTIRAHGLSIPEDMSVTGFDDVRLASQLITPLTTVRQPMGQMGWTAADLLLRQSSNLAPVEGRIFVPEIQIRDSSGHPSVG